MDRYALDPAVLRSVQPLIELALAEDIGTGDITSETTIPLDRAGQGTFIAKASGILAGLPVVALVLAAVDPRLTLTPLVADGMQISPKERLADIIGPARSLLTAERTALNFLQRLSGIATLTSKYVQAVEGTGALIVDTRKTMPGHRILDKYAIRVGGGSNHRFNLSDGILIKDNHIAAVGSVSEAVRRAQAAAGHLWKVEVEVKDLAEFREAVGAGAQVVLLDNMSDAQMAACVAERPQGVLLEASGNMSLERLPLVAALGVDFVSMGALTHSARACDISLELEPAP